MEDVDTVVVGAGIAGLAAAATLEERGVRAVVLEASERPGGRMWTRELAGCRADVGAQFVSTGYRALGALAGAAGIAAVPISAPDAALRLDDRWRRLRGPRDLVGILGATGAARFGLALARHARALASHDPSDLERWADLDTRDAAAWAPHAEERLVRPMLEALYFQEAHGTSQVLPLLVHAFSAQGAALAAWPGGMGTVPAALATRLDIRYGEPVTALATRGAQVLVEGPRRTWRARRVICAVPAPAARRLWRDAPPLERELLDTAYSGTIVASVVLDPGFELPRALDGVYGAWIPASARRDLVAFTVEGRKHPDRAPAAHLLNAMTTDAAHRTCAHASDDEVAARLLEELEAWLPGATRAVRDARVTRWPHAEPRTPVGRARAVAAYRAQTRGSVVLAGDYLAAPWTEGAARAGQWAAAGGGVAGA